MHKVITKRDVEEMERITIDGKEFVVECDVNLIGNGINSLRNKYNAATYSYFSYEDPEDPLTEEEYQKNIDDFMNEFEKRLDSRYIREVIKNTKKKKDGSFYKNRVYDEFILNNAENNGMGLFKLYAIRFKTSDDYVIQLIPIYQTAPQLRL